MSFKSVYLKYIFPLHKKLRAGLRAEDNTHTEKTKVFTVGM